MIAKRLLIFLSVSLILSSCGDKEEVEFEKPYFEVVKFVSSEMDRLGSSKPSITKTITTDGDSETHTTDTINWSYELAPLMELNINTPIWSKSYTIDTTLHEQHYEIVYTTDLENHPVTKLIVGLENGTDKCLYIEGFIKEENYVYSSWKHLSYVTDKEYLIEGGLEFRFIYNTQYKVEGKFVSI